MARCSLVHSRGQRIMLAAQKVPSTAGTRAHLVGSTWASKALRHGARLQGEHALQHGALAQHLHLRIALLPALRRLHLAHHQAPPHHLRLDVPVRQRRGKYVLPCQQRFLHTRQPQQGMALGRGTALQRKLTTASMRDVVQRRSCCPAA